MSNQIQISPAINFIRTYDYSIHKQLDNDEIARRINIYESDTKTIFNAIETISLFENLVDIGEHMGNFYYKFKQGENYYISTEVNIATHSNSKRNAYQLIVDIYNAIGKANFKFKSFDIAKRSDEGKYTLYITLNKNDTK